MRAGIRRILAEAWSVVAMGVFVGAALVALLGFELWREYTETETQAFRETHNLAAVLEEHVARSMSAADEILRTFASRAKAEIDGGTVDLAVLQAEAEILPEGLPQVGALTLLDSSGHVMVTTVPGVQRGMNLSDDEYFRHFATASAPEEASYTGALRMGRPSGRWIIPLSRGVYDANGKLAAVALVSIHPEAFVSLFDVLDIGQYSAVTLTQQDGVIVARSPNNERFIGRTLAGGELDRNLASQSLEGSVRFKGILYGRNLIVSYIRVTGTPYIINVAFDADRVFQPWMGFVVLHGVLGVLLLSAIAVCVWLVRRDQSRRTKIAASQQVHDIIEGMSTHVALLEPDGTVIEVNPALLATANRTRDDVIGRKLSETYWHAYSGDSRQRVRSAIQLAASGEIVRGDFLLRSGEGAYITVDTTFQTVQDASGGAQRIIASGVDVTERRRLERQLVQSQKMEAIGLLAGGIAHDFNNLLGVIANFAQFLTEDLKDRTKERGYAQRIAKACERGKQVVAQLLAYARPASVARSKTELGAVLAEVETMVRPSLSSSAAFVMDLGDASVEVNANEAQLTQIFVNLCFNARDALGGKSGSIHVRLAVVRPSDLEHPSRVAETHDDLDLAVHRTGVPDATMTYALVSVADSGVGMDAATLKRVFEPFYTTKARGEGTGLGLAIVDSIVLSLDGVCCVESSVGRGTRFSIYLPLRTTGSPAVRAQAPLSSPRLPPKLRVLIVDDDLAVADSMAIAIDRMGCEATVVDDPVEALEAFTKDPDAWDVVITDEHMPMMRGSDLIAELKAARPQLAVILFTGSESVTDAMALSWGADRLIKKPIDPAGLIAVLQDIHRSEKPRLPIS